MGSDETFLAAGYGVGSVPLGSRPAVLVVDFQQAFTRPVLPFGGSDHVRAAVRRTAPLLACARTLGVPVLHTPVAWRQDASDLGLWGHKVPDLARITVGSAHARTDPDLADPRDLVFLKQAPSAFFGTAVLRTLVEAGRDTVLVCGATTSGACGRRWSTASPTGSARRRSPTAAATRTQPPTRPTWPTSAAATPS